VRAGRFKRELFYSINALELHVPPLRERPEDIPPLVDHFVDKYRSDRRNSAEVRFTRDALDFLQSLPWPGNVGELENFVRRVLVLTDRTEVDVAQLESVLGKDRAVGEKPMGTSEIGSPLPVAGRVRPLIEQERDAIRQALAYTGGHIAEAAQLLGLHRNTLRRRIKKLRESGLW
jgi:DNA-binding NtrC family response regulator